MCHRESWRRERVHGALRRGAASDGSAVEHPAATNRYAPGGVRAVAAIETEAEEHGFGPRVPWGSGRGQREHGARVRDASVAGDAVKHSAADCESADGVEPVRRTLETVERGQRWGSRLTRNTWRENHERGEERSATVDRATESYHGFYCIGAACPTGPLATLPAAHGAAPLAGFGGACTVD